MRHINLGKFSNSLTLNDRYTILKPIVKGEPVTGTSKLIKEWIDNEPLALWNEVYSKGGASRIRLSKEAFDLLLATVEKINPELIKKKKK